MKRLDTADKLNGSMMYSIDLKLPGMRARSDQGLSGVRRQACELRRVENKGKARSPWRGESKRHSCRRRRRYLVAGQGALDALPIVWDEGPNASRSMPR